MIWVKNSIKFLFWSSLMLIQLSASAQSYVGRNVKTAIFSSTPIEDIRAVSVNGIAAIVSKTKEVVVQIPVKSLTFDRKLMQEHFNENYMESDKYPEAKFKGTIDQDIDFSKAGEYNVTVTGTLSIHGVDKVRTIPGKLTVGDGMLQIFTEFKVACVDHKIKIPKLVITKVAEVISVKVDGKLSLLK